MRCTKNSKPKIIIIAGPTASGKSALAIKLAKKFNSEIVSADSRQIYREMDIGTAKPTKKEMREIPHHLIDTKNPNQNYTLAQYKKDAIKAINKILKNGKTPFLVGGTGLYIKSVIENLDIPRVQANKKIRKKLDEKTTEELVKLIRRRDPETVKFIDVKNKRRLIRALEVILTTRQSFAAQRQKNKPLFNVLQIGIEVNRDKLYKRIDKRVEKMIKDGFVKETQKLLKKYQPSLHSMSGIGYKEIGEVLAGKIALKEAEQKIKNRTHSYARRQMTWFRKDKTINWVRDGKKAEKLIRKFFGDPISKTKKSRSIKRQPKHQL